MRQDCLIHTVGRARSAENKNEKKTTSRRIQNTPPNTHDPLNHAQVENAWGETCPTRYNPGSLSSLDAELVEIVYVPLSQSMIMRKNAEDSARQTGPLHICWKPLRPPV